MTRAYDTFELCRADLLGRIRAFEAEIRESMKHIAALEAEARVQDRRLERLQAAPSDG